MDSLVGYLEEDMKLVSEDIDNTRLISEGFNDMFRSVNLALKYSMVDYSNVLKKRDL